eukprot:TRINITY_DN5913_c0_g2_i3.p1 TRINITY_DN5913_c0_g2~~TRINITY_DN5913_c0_g2_i3.p1  ORF type:complete len:195 (-),score=52.10 TRINITY_DN5913_c0_g2_i3:1-585(-)
MCIRDRIKGIMNKLRISKILLISLLLFCWRAQAETSEDTNLNEQVHTQEEGNPENRERRKIDPNSVTEDLEGEIEEYRKDFKVFDIDRDGYIIREEIIAVVPNVDIDDLENFFRGADKNRDLKVDIDEYIKSASDVNEYFTGKSFEDIAKINAGETDEKTSEESANNEKKEGEDKAANEEEESEAGQGLSLIHI